MVNKNLGEEIADAIHEAKILECARDFYEIDHVLYVAQVLSGAPFSFVQHVYDTHFTKNWLTNYES